MGLKVKAVERLLRFDKNSAGEYRYVMKPDCSAQRCEPGCDEGVLGCSR